MRAFEIHTFKNGRWKIDSVFDDGELAVLEARRLNEEGLTGGVRVIEEEFDGQSRRTKMRTVYHSSAPSEAGRARSERDFGPGSTPPMASIPNAADPSDAAASGGVFAGRSMLRLAVMAALAAGAVVWIQTLAAAS